MLVGRLLRGLIFTIQKSLSHVHVKGMIICKVLNILFYNFLI
jgi:hypothetical protein